jgi:hypothetical protein
MREINRKARIELSRYFLLTSALAYGPSPLVSLLNGAATTQFAVPRTSSGWSMQRSPVTMWSRSSLSP